LQQFPLACFAFHFADFELEFAALLDALDFAVAYPHDAVGDVEHFEVVRGGDNRHAALFVEPFEQFDDLLACFEVEVACWLVGEDDGGVVGEGARDGDALLLSARQFGRLVVQASAQPDESQQFHPALARLVGVYPANTIGSVTFSSAVITGIRLKVWKM
jgi:hypothetical protein